MLLKFLKQLSIMLLNNLQTKAIGLKKSLLAFRLTIDPPVNFFYIVLQKMDLDEMR